MANFAEDSTVVNVHPGCVVVREGDTTFVFDSKYDSNRTADMSPVERAVIVARLRTIAAILNGETR